MKGLSMSHAKPISILAVDDEPGVLALVRGCMKDDEQVTVFAALSGKEALEHLAAGPVPDLLITDLHMPEIDGAELARRIRLQEPEMKVLYLTGFADGLFEAKPVLWDDEAYLDKPFTKQGLREAVALLLFGHPTL